MSTWEKMIERIAPRDSRRYTVYRIVSQACEHPNVILHYLNPYKIKRALYYLTHGGVKELNHVLEDRMLMGADLELELEIQKQIHGNRISDYPKLDFTELDFTRQKSVAQQDGLSQSEADPVTPLVSIIIPVYNQFDYTYLCLKTILEHSGDVNYEIILADDCSTDLTTQITEVVSGITVVKTKGQSYFLKNCNHAAKAAKGKYILFLNNDTQPQKNWLQPLVRLMEEREQIGMTGSCLVYPDGKLQEAGGILWKDGSAWNYGHGKNPAMPEFRYVKDADYISGAAIMIRRTLWEQLGGFDERFAPAYCEDSDLAFQVRQAGYRVVYQPQSVVVHFEGVSNGTDTGTGIKAYQVENQKKFYEKWKMVLEKEHLNNAEDPFLARDHSQTKKRILVIDHRVPWYDKDAGARTVIMYTRLFLELGLQVTFLPDDFYPSQPYTSELEQMGVETLYGNYFVNHVKDWLADNGKYFDYIYTNRPQVSIKYIDLLKKYSKAKIIYYGHDLHYLREQREYEIDHNEELLKSIERWKRIEFELIEKSDVVYAVGEYEAEVLKKEFPDRNIHCVPAYIYPEVPVTVDATLAGRKNLLFVGGFGHPPNIDAVLWFGTEVFPRIQEELPDVVWNIVGSKPTEEVQAMAAANEQIRLLGFVSDERLIELYKESRLTVVPLRYGAGVKGKVVECIYYQCPIITTPVGAEGLGMSSEDFCIVEADEHMAEAVVKLYQDDERLKKQMAACGPYINSHFTRRQAVEVVTKDIEI